MRISLKDFQGAAVDGLAGHAGRARNEAEDGQPQTLVLAAPTGSGKTVIATAWMERLYNGDAEREGDPNATFLWITDQPELNEQTRRKFDATSSVFFGSRLVTLDASFDQPLLDPGRVYFLNTQKVGKGQLLVTPGDRRATRFGRRSTTRPRTAREASGWLSTRPIRECPRTPANASRRRRSSSGSSSAGTKRSNASR